MSFETLEKTRSRAKITASANSDLDIVRGKYSDLVAEDDEYIEEVSIDKVVVSGANNICKIERGSNTVAVFDRAGVFDFAGNGVSLDKDSTAALKVKFLNSSSPGTVTIYLKKKTKLNLSDFYPTELFANLENGGIWDPSDLTSMFIGRNGSGGNPGGGDVVGMILDKRFMGNKTAAAFIAGQTELVTNGGFAADSDWTKGVGWSISGGAAMCDGSQGATTLLESDVAILDVAVGEWAVVTMTVSEVLAGSVSLIFRNAGGYAYQNFDAILNISAPGTYTQIIKKTVAAFFDLAIQASASFVGTISSVSLKEVPGNHLIAPSDAARPVLRDEIAEGVNVDVSAQPELVTNGDFASAAGWSTSTWTISDGTASIASAGAFAYLTQDILTAGKWYLVELDVVSVAGSSVRVGVGSGTYSGYWSTPGRKQFLARATGNTIFYIIGELGVTATIDNVSVREVPAAAARRWYLDFDGVDDSFASPSISPGVDKAQVGAAFYKDGTPPTFQFIMETGPSVPATPGTLSLLATSGSASPNINAISAGLNGSQDTAYDYTSYPVATPYVVSVQYDMAGASRETEIFGRINGAAPATSTGLANANAGSGNFTDQVLYVGARTASTLGFNGRLYGLVVRFGPTLSANELAALEAYLAEKSGVTLA